MLDFLGEWTCNIIPTSFINWYLPSFLLWSNRSMAGASNPDYRFSSPSISILPVLSYIKFYVQKLPKFPHIALFFSRSVEKYSNSNLGANLQKPVQKYPPKTTSPPENRSLLRRIPAIPSSVLPSYFLRPNSNFFLCFPFVADCSMTSGTIKKGRKNCANVSKRGSVKRKTDKSFEGPAVFWCDVCQRTYHTKTGLNQHKRYECCKEPAFACPRCEKRFKRKSSLVRHTITLHDETIYPTRTKLLSKLTSLANRNILTICGKRTSQWYRSWGTLTLFRTPKC